MTLARPGWYDDPTVRGGLRWWTGRDWTEYRRLRPRPAERRSLLFWMAVLPPLWPALVFYVGLRLCMGRAWPGYYR